MRELRNAYKSSVIKPEGKKPLGGPRYQWWNSMKMNLDEIECEGVHWIHMARGKVL
jgi:hypothetical protein